jgi:hypothetical protein
MVRPLHRWRAMRIGFVLEGVSDETVIPVLVRRALEKRGVALAPFSRDLLRRAHFATFAKKPHIYHGELTLKGADIVIAVFDNDGAPHDQRLRRIQDGLVDHPLVQLNTAVGVAVEEMEAWLLADVTALSTELGATVQQPPAAESIPDPKEHLNSIFASAGAITSDSASLGRIAERLDTDTLADRCRSFKRFHDELVHVAAVQAAVLPGTQETADD